MGFDDRRLRPLVCGDEFRDIKDFCIVADTRAYFTQSKRFVAVVASVLEVGAVFELLLHRELKHFLANGELAIHLLLSEAKADDVEEA